MIPVLYGVLPLPEANMIGKSMISFRSFRILPQITDSRMVVLNKSGTVPLLNHKQRAGYPARSQP